MPHVGNMIRTALKIQGFQQNKVAEALEMSPQQVFIILESESVTTRTLFNIAEVIDMKPSAILTLSGS